MRGLPGSGKSTASSSLFPNAVIASADSFFIDPETQQYNFNNNGLAAAHVRAQELCRLHMTRDAPTIVVDNCNLHVDDVVL